MLFRNSLLAAGALPYGLGVGAVIKLTNMR
jgi:hypothetical protein